MPHYCLQTKNYSGKDVVFDENNRQEHLDKHPELRDPAFIKRVKKVIEKPQYVYPSVYKKEVHCYYSLDFYQDTGRGRVNRYTKVVIMVKAKPCRVMTAFRTNIIREKGQTKCLRRK